MKRLFIIIITVVLLSQQSQAYQLHQFNKTGQMYDAEAYITSIAKLQIQQLLTFYSIFITHCYLEGINIGNNCTSRILRHPTGAPTRTVFWTVIKNKNYLLFLFQSSFCVENLQDILETTQSYKLCQHSSIQQDSIQAYIQLQQTVNMTYIYALVNQIQFTKYSINQEGTIQRVGPTFSIDFIDQDYLDMLIANYRYEQFYCLYAYDDEDDQPFAMLYCFDFGKQIYFQVDLLGQTQENVEKIKVYVRENYILFWYQTDSDLPAAIYNITIDFDGQNVTLTRQKVNKNKELGFILALYPPAEDSINGDWFGTTQIQVDDGHIAAYVNIFKLIDNEITYYQIIPNYDIISFKQVIRGDYSMLFTYEVSDQRLIFFSKIQLTGLKQEIQVPIYTYSILIFIALLLVASSYSIVKYYVQTKYFLQQVKVYFLKEAIAVLAQFITFGVIILTIDTNDNKAFTFLKSYVSIDSFYTRLFYYLVYVSSLINGFYIIFAQNKLKSNFTHLLSKHSFNLKALIIIKSIFLIIKLALVAIICILFVYWMESTFSIPFTKQFGQLFQLSDNCVTILIASLILLISLSALAYIILQVSSSMWYTLEIFIFISFLLSFVTEYFYLEEAITNIQYSFIFLSPFTMFSTIIQAAFMTKNKYSQFRKLHSINLLLIFSIVQMVVLIVGAVFLTIKRIKITEIESLFKTPITEDIQKSMLTSNQQNLMIPHENASENEVPILHVYIPCKISTYRGFQKKILENITFKGCKNEIISFIDYTNESKSVLMKILTNDEKSDSFLQEDLKGEIYYTKEVKVSVCSDKNIFCQGLTAIQHLDLFLSLKNRSLTKKQRLKQVKFMLNEFNITDQDSIKEVRILSGGNQKKLCLACAFIGNPEVVIINEPTMGLDLRFKRIFWQKLKEWKEQRLIIIGTSDNQQAETISNKIYIISNAKMSNYLTFKSKKYFELTLDFFAKENIEQCKAKIGKQFNRDEFLQFQELFQNAYRLKLQIYDIYNTDLVSKITKLIKYLDLHLKKNYYFYFKTNQTKFTVQQFYKYKHFFKSHLRNRENKMIQEMQEIKHKQITQYNELQEDYLISQSESYYQKEVKTLLGHLSKIEKKQNINYQQIKSIIYYKVCFFKNENLVYKEAFLATLFFWISNIIDIVYESSDEKFTQYEFRSQYYGRVTVIFCYLFVSPIFNTSTETANQRLLISVGMNFRNVWIGEWIFNTLYLSVSLLVNITIYIIYLFIFQTVQENLIILYLGSLLYILNFTLLVLVLLVIIKNKQNVALILLLFMIIPFYVYNDMFLLNYPNSQTLIRQILSFVVFPVTFSQLYQHSYGNNVQLKYLGVLLYELAFTLTILWVYERISMKNQRKITILPLGSIHNVANDDIIQQQRIVQELFENKEVVLGHNVCKKYPNESKTWPSLRNIYFHCQRGEILSFVGHNGCGKTSLFNAITNKITTSTGKISILGKLQTQMNFTDRLQIGYCTQEGQLFNDFTLQQNIRFIGLLKGLQQKYLTKYAIKMLKYFKLYNKEKALISELSEGEKKKICIIIALLGFPSFVIFDEPTSSIDSQSRSKILHLIKNYSVMLKSAILITTHNINQAESFSNRVSILKKGILLKAGTIHELMKHPSQELYRLVISFSLAQNQLILSKNKKKVITFVRQFVYVDIVRQQGFRFIYGLDLLKIDMLKVLVKMMDFFQSEVITKFNLYKYDLQEVVRYNMSVDESHELKNEQDKLKRKLIKQLS